MTFFINKESDYMILNQNNIDVKWRGTTSSNYSEDFLEEHKRVMESRLQPVVREITDSRARTKEELESLYRKIVSAILLRSGLGSPTDINVVREATGELCEHRTKVSRYFLTVSSTLPNPEKVTNISRIFI